MIGYVCEFVCALCACVFRVALPFYFLLSLGMMVTLHFGWVGRWVGVQMCVCVCVCVCGNLCV